MPFSLLFLAAVTNVITGRETVHLALSPTDLGVFLIFPKALNPKSSVVRRLVRQLVCKVYYFRNQALIYLRLIKPLRKHCIVLLYWKHLFQSERNYP